jgi:hypothetical protein
MQTGCKLKNIQTFKEEQEKQMKSEVSEMEIHTTNSCMGV